MKIDKPLSLDVIAGLHRWTLFHTYVNQYFHIPSIYEINMELSKVKHLRENYKPLKTCIKLTIQFRVVDDFV